MDLLEVRFSLYDIVRLLLGFGTWIGALLLFALLAWARTRIGWGWESSRDLLANIIDICLLLCLLMFWLGLLPIARTFDVYGSEIAIMRVGIANLAILFLIVWLGIGRWLVWALPLRRRQPQPQNDPPAAP